MLQELEKNEQVKLWLEVNNLDANLIQECKRRCIERTKAWDIHSLLIKPVQRVLKYPLLLQGV
jgi:dynamin-binding protein